MTSFDALESSVEGSRPVELYEFAKGGTFYRFCTHDDTLTVGGFDYEPIAIARSGLAQGADQANRNLTVTMPASVDLAGEYIDVPPGERLDLNIYRYQRDESPSFATQVLIFKGVVQSVRFPNDGTAAEFAVRSIENALNDNVPRFTFMGMCNHILFDAACGIDPSLFDHLGTCTAASDTDNTVTVSGLGASGIDFVGGYIRPTGINDFRMVIEQSGDVLTLLLPFQVDPTGSNMQAFAGCDHTLTGDCALVFDNVINFGGFHYVPSKDIFREGLD